jgi:poly(A)-specific ribonuclease
MGYSIIQFGLTCFRKNSEHENGQQSWTCHSFNIFIFPYKVPGLPRHLERNVEMQTSAVSFLRAHGFDFNVLFDEGISYLTLKEEQECEKAFRDNEEKTCQQGTVVPDDCRDFVDQCVRQVHLFVSEDGDPDQRLDLPVCTAFKRKLLNEALSGDELRERISITTLPVAPASRDCFLSVTRSNPAAKRKRSNDILTEAAGFTKILQIISRCKKPLVGHNLFLDIMHLVGQFLTELPDSYDEFKEAVHDMFPALYDTKYIATTVALRKIITSTTLEDLNETLSHEPFKPVIIHPVIIQQKSDSTRHENKCDTPFHQAGYDSYITGHCFIRLNNFLQQVLGEKNADNEEVIGSEIRRYVSNFISQMVILINYSVSVLSLQVNRLNLTYSFDLDHYFLGGEEVLPIRDHVFHVSFPSQWNTQSIVQLFAPYGSVQINWINDSSAFVGLKDATRSRALSKNLSGSSADPAVQILPYYEFRSHEEHESTSNSSKRSSDGAKVRTSSLMDERKRVVSTQESGKRVRRDVATKDQPFQEEKDW